MTIEQAREIIAARLRERRDIWTDERLAQTMAFCEDGKMNAMVPCCCFIGVETSAPHIRSACPTPGHYAMALVFQRESLQNEEAYFSLGGTPGGWAITELGVCRIMEAQPARDREFLAILRAEIARRDEERRMAGEREREAVGVEVAT